MTSKIKWSFSSDRCFRRCQRQYFFRDIAAWHNAKDEIRREAYVRKQLKTLEQWQGILVHKGIELYVVPKLQRAEPIDWDDVMEKTIAMAKRQYEFSEARKYADRTVSKVEAGDNFAALLAHETGEGVSQKDLQEVFTGVKVSFVNLSKMSHLLIEIGGRNQYWPELVVYVEYDRARIDVRLDLLFFKRFGNPTIVDWKVSKALGGSDAQLQTALYAWALCRHPKWKVEQAEDCELLEVNLLSQEVVRHHADKAMFNKLENRIYRSLDKICTLRDGRKFDIANIEDYDIAVNPNNCKYCVFRELCQRFVGQQDVKVLSDKCRL